MFYLSSLHKSKFWVYRIPENSFCPTNRRFRFFQLFSSDSADEVIGAESYTQHRAHTNINRVLTYRKACVRLCICVIGVLRSGAGEPPGDSASDSNTSTLANAKSSSFMMIEWMTPGLWKQQKTHDVIDRQNLFND